MSGALTRFSILSLSLWLQNLTALASSWPGATASRFLSTTVSIANGSLSTVLVISHASGALVGASSGTQPGQWVVGASAGGGGCLTVYESGGSAVASRACGATGALGPVWTLAESDVVARDPFQGMMGPALRFNGTDAAGVEFSVVGFLNPESLSAFLRESRARAFLERARWSFDTGFRGSYILLASTAAPKYILMASDPSIQARLTAASAPYTASDISVKIVAEAAKAQLTPGAPAVTIGRSLITAFPVDHGLEVLLIVPEKQVRPGLV
jgi:hypothetical protein